MLATLRVVVSETEECLIRSGGAGAIRTRATVLSYTRTVTQSKSIVIINSKRFNFFSYYFFEDDQKMRTTNAQI